MRRSWRRQGAWLGLILGLAVLGCRGTPPTRYVAPKVNGPGATSGRTGTLPAGVTPGQAPPEASVPAGNGQPTGPTPALPGQPTPGTLPTTPVAGGGGGGGSSSGGPVINQVQLGGVLSFPARVVSNNGGAILANNGSGILANNGGNVISNNGGGILSDQGGLILSDQGGLILSDQGGLYRLAEAGGPEKGLVRAFMYLTDRDERFHVSKATGKIFTTTSKAGGAYDFGSTTDAGFPLGKDAVVNALLPGNLRLVGFTVPQAGGQTLKVNLGSTLGSEFLRGEAFAQGRVMSSYDLASFRQVVALTDDAIATGAINAIEVKPDGRGTDVVVNNFDLRLDQTQRLRNQYVVSFTAVDVANAALRAISDGWKSLFGERPVAVTSLVGSGQDPTVDRDLNAFVGLGFATGDDRGGPVVARAQLPLGRIHGMAVSARGDVFISAYTEVGASGHIRWIKPDGTITSLWQPTLPLFLPLGLAIEKEPTDDVENNPGVLLVADAGSHMVLRLPIVDRYAPVDAMDPGLAYLEKHPMGIVAGEAQPFFAADDTYYGVGSLFEAYFGASLEKDHPGYVDGALPSAAGRGAPQDSAWRASDEGERRYAVGDGDHPASSVVPNSARYAHLNFPRDVEVDELGNVYIADQLNHRVRFIPSSAALAAEPDHNFFDYRAPIVDGTGAVVDFAATPTPMVAGAIYTIAGNPHWDPAREPNDPRGAWVGEFLGSDGVRAQLAHLDQPLDLAFDQGKLYVADTDNNRIRVIDRATGLIQTLAGNPPEPQQVGAGGDRDYPDGFTGDGGPANLARLAHPQGLAIDKVRHLLYIADSDAGRLRVVNLATGILQTVAGRLHDGRVLDADHREDGEARHWADLYQIRKLGVDPQGNVIFNDGQHGRVRKLWRQWE